ncbi:MAG: TIGR01777 family protein [Sorangiineae bacterium NIC37A_2]|nr:MAG: TIGR01777 family protein [Sorangiineae bacterium NIC37A_2]
MKTLVTGGTGFVGKALVSALRDAGGELVVPSRSLERARRTFRQSQIEVVSWDGRSTLDLRGVDRIVHLAGEPAVGRRYTSALKQEIWASRVESARALTESIRLAGTHGPTVFVSASGVGYYGPREPHEPCKEDDPPGKDFLAKVCVDWEQAVREAESLGVRTASLRFGVVLGKRGGALAVMARPFQAMVGGPLGDGRQMFPWVHEEDAVRALIFALERRDVRGPLNLAAPEFVSNEEFSKALGRALHRPSFLRAPAFALRALFGEGAEPLLTGQRAVPDRLTSLGFTFRFSKLDEALRDCFS